MSISNVISLLSGVALFLFGMALMGEGLKKVAGSRLEIVLYRLTGTPLKGSWHTEPARGTPLQSA